MSALRDRIAAHMLADMHAMDGADATAERFSRQPEPLQRVYREDADAILALVAEHMASDAAAAFIHGWQAAKSRALDAIDDWAVPDDVNKVRVRDAIRYATEGDKNGPEAALAATIGGRT